MERPGDRGAGDRRAHRHDHRGRGDVPFAVRSRPGPRGQRASPAHRRHQGGARIGPHWTRAGAGDRPRARLVGRRTSSRAVSGRRAGVASRPPRRAPPSATGGGARMSLSSFCAATATAICGTGARGSGWIGVAGEPAQAARPGQLRSWRPQRGARRDMASTRRAAESDFAFPAGGAGRRAGDRSVGDRPPLSHRRGLEPGSIAPPLRRLGVRAGSRRGPGDGDARHAEPDTRRGGRQR